MSYMQSEMTEFHADFSTLDIQSGLKLIEPQHTISVVINPAESIPVLRSDREQDEESLRPEPDDDSHPAA